MNCILLSYLFMIIKFILHEQKLIMIAIYMRVTKILVSSCMPLSSGCFSRSTGQKYSAYACIYCTAHAWQMT